MRFLHSNEANYALFLQEEIKKTGVKNIIKKSRPIVTKLFIFQQYVPFAYFNVIFDKIELLCTQVLTGIPQSVKRTWSAMVENKL